MYVLIWVYYVIVTIVIVQGLILLKKELFSRHKIRTQHIVKSKETGSGVRGPGIPGDAR